MKFTFSFMGLLLLLLSCMPCRDSRECTDSAATNISSAADHRQHADEESCTPFCTCSCCAVAAFYPSLLKTTVAIAFQPGKYTLRNTAFLSEVYYSIWQPPKIA